MVSKRQKLAKKRFKEANPELFPAPAPTKDTSEKKKNSKFKRQKLDPNGPNNPKKSSHKKHPLRVAGMRPGESCFMCKAPDHISKNCPQKSEWERNKICLSCRQRGHSLKNCPKKNDAVEKKFCYNCGETGHSLSNCRQPLQDGGTKYASCFICKETGHLSKNCPKNTHGIYPKGGSCKICGGITHLARDCPDKGKRTSDTSNMIRQSFESHERPNKITRFISGDDLEDDFTSILPLSAKDQDSKEAGIKKKQGTKWLIFLGDHFLLTTCGIDEQRQSNVFVCRFCILSKILNELRGFKNT